MIRLDPYELIEPIGKGGSSVVWRARHLDGGPELAVKVLRPDAGPSGHRAALLQAELRALAALDHPAIVAVFDLGEVPASAAASGEVLAGSPFLVMELVEGGTLVRRLGRLSWAAIRQVLLDVLDALGHAHGRGIIHRDVKPGNILLSPHSLGPIARLTDFGLAWEREADPASQSGREQGTPSYISPEQILGQNERMGPWTDLYSLACTAWALATGSAPHKRGSARASLKAHLDAILPPFEPAMQCPDGFGDWLRALLRKEPGDRIPSAGAAAEALRLIDEGRAPRRPDDLRVLVPKLPLQWPTRHQRPVEPPARRCTPLTDSATPVLVGRQEEQQRLWSWLSTVCHQRMPRGLVLEGPTGLGKTRLARWLCSEAEAAGAARAVAMRHGPDPHPMWGLRPALRRLLLADGLERRGLEDAIRMRLRRLDGEQPWLVAAIADALGPEGSLSRSVISHHRMDDRLQVLVRLLLLEARSTPLLFIIDDAQWALEALALAERLLIDPAAQDHPIGVILTVQPRELTAGSPEARLFERVLASGACSRLPVGSLSLEATRELVLNAGSVSSRQAAVVAARAQGSPVVALQLLTAGQELPSSLELEASRYLTESGSALPDLNRLWLQRIQACVAGLPETAEFSLEVAAALGTEVDLVEWQQSSLLAGYDPPEQAMARLASAGLVLPRPSGFSFAHGLLQDALVRRSRAAGRWAWINSACGEALRRSGGQVAAERMATHMREAGRLEDACALLLEAAQHATLYGDLSGSEALLQRRDDLLDRLQVAHDGLARSQAQLVRLQNRALQSGAVAQGPSAGTIADRAADAGWPVVRAEALLLLGDAQRDSAEFEEAIETLEEAAEAAEAAGRVDLLARIDVSLGRTLQERGELEGALRAFERAMTESQDSQQAHEGGAAIARAHILCDLGRFAEARSSVEQVRDSAVAFGNLREVAAADGVLARILVQHEGQFEAAEAALLDALGINEALGNRAGLAVLWNNLGELRRSQNRLPEAAEAYRRALREYDEQGSTLAVIAEANLGLLDVLRGNWGPAMKQLPRVRRNAQEAGRKALSASIDAMLMRCAAAIGDWTTWDRFARSLTQALDERVTLHADSPGLLEDSATEAEARGQHTRAATGWRLSAATWALLGRDRRAREAERQAARLLQLAEESLVTQG